MREVSVVDFTVRLSLIFVVRVLSLKYFAATVLRTDKMLEVIFPAKSSNIVASQGVSASVTKQIKPSEIVIFAQWYFLSMRCIRIR